MNNRSRVLRSLPPLLLLLCFVLLGLYMYFVYPVDSDMSSELLLAQLLAREGGLLSENWFYSTELRLLNTQLINIPLFHLFSGWKCIRVLSCLLHALLLVGSFFFLMRSLGMKKGLSLPAVFLLLPWSYCYFRFTVAGSYYVPHIAAAFLTVGLLLRFPGKSRRSSLLLAGGNLLLALGAGLGGPREIAVLYGPLLLSCALLRLPGLRRPGERLLSFSGPGGKRLLLSLGLFLASLGGLWGNSLLSAHYEVYSFSHISLCFRPEILPELLMGLLSALGFSSEAGPRNELSSRLPNLFVLLAAAALLWLILRCLRRRRELSEEELLLPIFLLSGLAALTALYVFTDMLLEPRYFLPVLVFALPAAALTLRSEERRERRPALLLAAALLLSSLAVLPSLPFADTYEQHAEMAETLTGAGYVRGYASFWNANVLTEFSDGELELWTFLEQPSKLYPWLQKTAHREPPPEGPLFLLLNKSEDAPLLPRLREREALHETPDLILYGFESRRELQPYACGYEGAPGEAGFFFGGEFRDGELLLSPEGVSFGPYITLWPGRYRLTLRGEKLDALDFDLTGEKALEAIPVVDALQSSDTLSYSFHIDKVTEDVEFRFFNNSPEDVLLRELQLSFLEP